MSKKNIKNNKEDIKKEDIKKDKAKKLTAVKSDEKIKIGRSKGKQSGQRNWYVIHTYSGFEEQVAEALKQRIESLHMQDKIFDVLVPIEKQVEMRGGKRRTIEKKVF